MLITDWLKSEIDAKSLFAKVGLSSSIVFLFLCLYTVSDRHLTVALRHIAKGLRMPADLAGMTLLAFGNGAPDFFTAVFGASEAPEMILSGAVGAALFTFTIVFGLVMILQTVPREEEALLTKVIPFPFFRNALLCMFCSSTLFLFLRVGTIKYWMLIILLSVYICNLAASIIAHMTSESPPSTHEIEKRFVADYSAFWHLSTARKMAFLWSNIGWNAVMGPLPIRCVTYLARIIRLPMSLILHVSILPMKYPEPADASLDSSVALFFINRCKFFICPLTSVLLFELIFASRLQPVLFWLLHFVLSASASAFLWFTSSWTRKPRFLVFHAVYAFVTCLGFIYLISRELISCLRSLGLVIGVSPSTMGVLVLAWGNSFGDLVADTTMARTGFLNMALFGVFAAHIQNVLFTLGVAFLLATLQTPTWSLDVKDIDPKVYIGMCIVATVLILSLVLVPTIGRFTLPRWCGFILLCFYITFACVALLLEFQVVQFL